jgi:predicted Zn-ribbon and HTH transcriptional regulator
LTAKTTAEDKTKLLDQLQSIANTLRDANIRVEVNASDHQSAGWKFNEYEASFYSNIMMSFFNFV